MKMLAAVSIAIAVLAADPPDITGTWNMGLQGDHVIPIALVLKQQEKKVTGTIALPTQQTGQRIEVELTGEFVNAALNLSGTVESAAEPTTITISGSLKDDGTLEGTLSMPNHGRVHNLPWTAERLKERK